VLDSSREAYFLNDISMIVYLTPLHLTSKLSSSPPTSTSSAFGVIYKTAISLRKFSAVVVYSDSDSDVMSSYHIYASCFSAICGASSAKCLLL